MSTTWMQPQVRHPWFHSFATKRKHWPNCDNMAADASRPVKRRRYSTLERGFAHLSLVGGPAMVEDAEDVEMPMEADAWTSSSVVKDVKMRKSTWYEREPDRIVVTELETSSDEETETQEDEEEGLYVFSPALLKHIRSHSLHSSFKQTTSQALVLYQPATISMDSASPAAVADKKLMIDGQDAMDRKY